MKLSPILLSLPIFGNVAIAAPAGYTVESRYAPDQSPSVSGIALADLEKRAGLCQNIAKTIWSGKRLLAAGLFATGATKVAKSICQRHDNKECALWVDDIKDVFDLIFALTAAVSGGVANLPEGTPSLNLNPVDAPGAADVKRSFAGSHMLTSTGDALRQHGWTLDSIEDIPISKGSNQARDDIPALIAHHRLKNMRNVNGTKAHDYELHHFADGSSHTFVPFTSGNATLTKRHDGAGVKVVFARTGVAVSKDEYAGAPAAIASAWDEHAEAGSSDWYGMAERSMANGAQKAVIYWRTILEADGYGENYERLDGCGKMGGYVGQYLVGEKSWGIHFGQTQTGFQSDLPKYSSSDDLPNTVCYRDIELFYLRDPKSKREVLCAIIEFCNLKGRPEGADG
ncbi:hypothetical protein N7532_009424 [Penicillium argentinense]|uniref:Uncharacterized protein n=1 Tax=Penicillium argentinense TaxID=1131581 RepID=A0A9W9EZD4_9EURO|nr:uncharacterized protein N7532_009424 [Penicillium argentinense]KAJ5090740.1 hypothetical protein N7532_009424 [Penicillium argentinense]